MQGQHCNYNSLDKNWVRLFSAEQCNSVKIKTLHKIDFDFVSMSSEGRGNKGKKGVLKMLKYTIFIFYKWNSLIVPFEITYWFMYFLHYLL